MRRSLHLLISLILLLLLSACSYHYDFVVINKSAGPIEVRYQLKRYTPETPGRFVDVHAPAKLTVAEFQKSEHEWNNLRSDQYQFDNLSGTFTVSVAPDEVLFLQSASNYGGDENEFDIASIQISGAQGSIDLQGRQAQTQFKFEASTTYALRYR